MKATLVYDGDCGFCTSSVRFVQRWIRPRGVDVIAWQHADLPTLGVTQQRAEYELLWITPAGAVDGGAQAVARLLLAAGRCWVVPGALLTLPPLRWLAHGVYRLVANNRGRLPGGTAACALPAGRRPGAS